MKAVIYARYSSERQTEQSIEGQLHVCHDYAKANQWTIIDTYVDRALSGKTSNRPQFQRMVEASESGAFDVVLVYKLDRFARNRYDSATYKAKLKRNGVKVISATENISDNPEGIILESLLEGMAEYYSAELSQKVSRGLRESALKCQCAGGTIPLGYQISKEKKFVEDPLTSPIVKQIFSYYDGGMTIVEIISTLNAQGYKTSRGNPFNKNSLYKILRNRRYCGTYLWGDVQIPDGMPRLISDEQFERVQKRLGKNRIAPASGKANQAYLLTTKLFCGYCGAPMIGDSGVGKGGDRYTYYTCGNRKHGNTCHKKAIRKDKLESYLITYTITHVLQDDTLSAIAQTIVDMQVREQAQIPVQGLQEALTTVESSIRNLLKMVEEGFATQSTKERLMELEAEKEDLQIRIAQEQVKAKTIITKDQIMFWFEQFKNGDTDSLDFQRSIIDTFLLSVVLYEDHAVIHYNYHNGQKKISADELSVLTSCSDSTTMVGTRALYPNITIHENWFSITVEIS